MDHYQCFRHHFRVYDHWFGLFPRVGAAYDESAEMDGRFGLFLSASVSITTLIII